ncbi:hypothetical protein LR48_Vigan01g068600 [Vigna angularis]|uniref:Uncharacterized protein n=1 Tax=Phaseolus angularis TaxID=3914 RepID=A0A0L9TKX7_PHAAN|nr:hypothetical protein LR48_Vigan01g068600 [Vigna angularis]
MRGFPHSKTLVVPPVIASSRVTILASRKKKNVVNRKKLVSHAQVTNRSDCFPIKDSSHPRKLTLVLENLLNVKEKIDVDLLLQLPRPIFCREVLCVLHAEHPTALFEAKSVPLEVVDLTIEDALGESVKETQVEDTQVIKNPLA